jgi:adenylate kinase
MARIVFLGPPGAGKGTQAHELARTLGVPHLSTGDLLRSAVAANSPVGRRAEGFMRAGQLVPDDVVLEILREELAKPSARPGYLLDGFPRTRAQAEALETVAPVDRVVYFEIPEPLLVERLTQRRTCPSCGRSYNLSSHRPSVEGRCDVDGTSLVQRPDDTPEAVRTRLEVYRAQTAPLLQYFAERGRLRRIDASGDVPTVARRVRAAVA